MALFSQRKGIRPLKKAVQREAVDDELRSKLWSGLKLVIWDRYTPQDALGYMPDDSHRLLTLVQVTWLHYFKQPIDVVPEFNPRHGKSAYGILREHFLQGEWWEVYDFIEFIAKQVDEDWKRPLLEISNGFLEQESSAYRFVGTEIVEITSETEISAIEGALNKSTKESRIHFTRALELMSDRKKPDYRNSIKESVSAVESLCKVVSANPKGTLGDCLKLLKDKAPIHTALEAAFLKLYGYTSDAGGIRHALIENSQNPSFADAKFMLVACSAFNSFLLGKAAENGVHITGA